MGKPRHTTGRQLAKRKRDIYSSLQIWAKGQQQPYVEAHACMHALSCLTPWTTARQAPLSRGFFRQEYWSRFPFSPPTDLPNPGVEPTSPAPPALQTGSLLLSHQRSPHCCSLNRKTRSSTPVKLAGLYFIKYNVMIFRLLRPETWDTYLWLISFSQTPQPIHQLKPLVSTFKLQ